jgi:Domain of unknown function (DUF4160)
LSEKRVGEIAAKAVVQLLFATGKSFTVDGLREKLHEFFRQEVRAELRAVAALNNVELISALISGSIPQRQQRLVEVWAELHQDDLLSDWNLESISNRGLASEVTAHRFSARGGNH